MSERTWSDIGNEIRDDYLRADGPENIKFREVQWDVWLAEVEREAAARALEEFAEKWATQDGIEALMFAKDDVSAVLLTEKAILARAAEIREAAPVTEEGDKE